MSKAKIIPAIFKSCLAAAMFLAANEAWASWEDFQAYRDQTRQKDIEELQKRFQWWPTDATPGPVKDEERSGYWWWPNTPGEVTPWGNRGYIYVYKLIFDYKEEELPAPKPQELRPSLLIKKMIKNVKIYFDYDKADLRNDHIPILLDAVKTLQRNPEADILITGNCDLRGSEAYNLKLGRRRAQSVEDFLVKEGVAKEHIRILSRGKLDAVAPLKDLTGMQKDRNAQFMIAEVEEVMVPYPEGLAVSDTAIKPLEKGKFYLEEEEQVESKAQVSLREYVVQKGDTLWKIAQKEYGGGYRWKYLYELNKDRIKDPNKLKPGMRLAIPVE